MASDPRLEQRGDIMPIVARPASGLSGLAIGVGAVAAGLLLFGILEARRQQSSGPAVTTRGQDATVQGVALPPTLYIPPDPLLNRGLASDSSRFTARLSPPLPATSVPRTPARPRFPDQSPIVPLPGASFPGAPGVLADPAARLAPPQPIGAGSPTPAGPPAAPPPRVQASMLVNKSTTVPQGTLIPAVLETAFDSTRAGFARALVQRDVRGFDGTRVLVPRGSRLIGEYLSNNAPGQNRALINWTRLIRPDGATIALASPTTDTVGRGGVKASVNSHFLERFSGAILQTALDLGVVLAARSADGPLFVGVPGAYGGLGSALRPREIPPTLKVPAGTSMSVFVARDLDFNEVERGGLP